jgi:hypothetical protein
MKVVLPLASSKTSIDSLSDLESDGQPFCPV